MEQQHTFVLVHPAWHGAWFWRKVAPLLRRTGDLVLTPTLTGLGERSHLLRPEIGLDVHVTDVVNVLNYDDLHDVVLVGHSSSGGVITGVADRAGQRIALLSISTLSSRRTVRACSTSSHPPGGRPWRPW
jgi:pimeloyl-ACP methyl ester carboxylesterase